MTFTNPHLIVRHPYKVTPIHRGGDAIIDLLILLKSGGARCFIAGGFARWMLSDADNPADATDIDIFFDSLLSFDSAQKTLASAGFLVLLDTKNAVTLIPPGVASWQDCIQVQLVKPVNDRYGTFYDVLDRFDLTVCQAGVELTESDKLLGYCSELFTIDEKRKTLRIAHISNELITIYRCMKYSKKGYHMSMKEALKIMLHWDGKSQDVRSKIKELVESSNTQEAYDLMDLS